VEPGKQEVLAAILWRFIEEIREQKQSGAVLTLDPAEARELLDLLVLAARVSDTMAETETPEASNAAARHRLERAIWEQPSGPILRPEGRPEVRDAVPSAFPRRRWAWATAGAAVVLAASLIGIDVGRLLPRPDPLTHPPASVQALSHTRVQQWLPALIQGQLSPPQARAMWWHLAHCDDCFHIYEQMRAHAPRRRIGERGADDPPERVARGEAAKLGRRGQVWLTLPSR
jgi:putative zinc finger protein